MSSTTPNLSLAEDSITRRRLLGGAIGTTAVLTGVPSPTAGRGSEIPVSSLSSMQIVRRLPELVADRDVRKLHAELRKDGLRPALKGAVGHRAPESTPAGPYNVIAIPYLDSNRSQEGVLLWTDGDVIQTQSRQILPGDSEPLEMHTSLIEANGITSIVTPVNPEFWGFFCWDINWSCLFSIAGAWAGAFGSCATCVIEPSRLSCFVCAGAVSSALGTTLGCDICD